MSRHLARARRRAALVAAGALFAGAVTSAFASAHPAAAAPEDDLPDGPGKKVLVRACTTCHDLDEVVKFKGYYTLKQWRDIVVTMKEYGASLDEGEVDVLADYITGAIGKRD